MNKIAVLKVDKNQPLVLKNCGANRNYYHKNCQTTNNTIDYIVLIKLTNRSHFYCLLPFFFNYIISH